MSKPTLDVVVTEFHDTGPCTVDCDVIAKLWDRLWLLSQWKNEYRLVKFLRKDSPNTRIKISISNEQAEELKTRLGLVCSQGSFTHSKTWRLAEHS